MSVNLAPGPFGVGGQFFSGNTPLNAGLIYTYAAGTSTPQPTFTTSAGNIQNANPIVLNINGILPQEVWLTAGIAYKFIVTDSLGNVIFPYTMDNITGINDFSSIPTGQEWIETGLTPQFVSASSFTLPGDQTQNFKANRRVRLQETAGTVYGTVISSSVLSAITTVNVTIDSSGSVDSGLSDVAFGILDSQNLSIPPFILAGTNVTVTYANAVPTIAATVPIIRSYLAGLGMSTAGSSTTMTIGPGQAADSTNVVMMSLLLSTNKTTSAWVVGTNVGGLDAGTIANNTSYHFYEIRRPDTGIVDVCFSTSATGLVAGSYVSGGGNVANAYTQFRYIGSMTTNGSAQWTSFTQDGDYFRLFTSVLDYNVTNPGTGAVTASLSSIPTGFNLQSLINISVSPGASNSVLYFSDLASSAMVPSATLAPLGQINAVGAGAVIEATLQIRTNTSAQIRYQSTFSDGSLIVKIATLGWLNTRGRNL